MSSNVVNLNRFRKKKQREEKAKQAEKDRERAERARATRLLEGKQLERGPDEVVEAGAATDGPDDV